MAAHLFSHLAQFGKGFAGVVEPQRVVRGNHQKPQPAVGIGDEVDGHFLLR